MVQSCRIVMQEIQRKRYFSLLLHSNASINHLPQAFSSDVHILNLLAVYILVAVVEMPKGRVAKG